MYALRRYLYRHGTLYKKSTLYKSLYFTVNSIKIRLSDHLKTKKDTSYDIDIICMNDVVLIRDVDSKFTITTNTVEAIKILRSYLLLYQMLKQYYDSLLTTTKRLKKVFEIKDVEYQKAKSQLEDYKNISIDDLISENHSLKSENKELQKNILGLRKSNGNLSSALSRIKTRINKTIDTTNEFLSILNEI